MANHANIYTKESVDGKKLKELLESVNEERFGGKLVFKVDDECEYFMALVDEYNSYIEIWIPEAEADHKLEIRHGHGMTTSWYTDMFISHWITEKLNGTIVDDSDGKAEAPYFHKKYPTRKDYFRVHYGPSFPFICLLKTCRYEKKLCGDMWSVL